MQCEYRLREDTLIGEDGQKHTVYGIEAVDGLNNLIRIISDVFFDKQKAMDFINLCNTERLSLVHLENVIEDIMIE